jgi:hypothetical protein
MPRPALLDAFLQEHRRSGDLDGGLDGETVWLACSCGAQTADPATEPPPQPRSHAPTSGEPLPLM